MMRLYRVGTRALNMDLLMDAAYDPAKERLELRFSGPQPASVAASDWTVEAYQVVLKGTEAADCWEWISYQSTPAR